MSRLNETLFSGEIDIRVWERFECMCMCVRIAGNFYVILGNKLGNLNLLNIRLRRDISAGND